MCVENSYVHISNLYSSPENVEPQGSKVLYWEANSFLAGQEIVRVLWNPKIHYRIDKSLPNVPDLSLQLQSTPRFLFNPYPANVENMVSF